MSAPVNSLSYRFTTSLGFTLIELMVTIAVLAIIVSIAAPNISTQLANQRIKSTTATLTNALKEAKVESVIRRQVLTLSVNNNGTALGTIIIRDPGLDQKLNIVATYQYDSKSTINSTQSSIEFKPSKTTNERTYTICDSNTSISPRQIIVSTIANITNKLGGTCP
ncbi:type IV fimbrial biogenesis protein FimT [Psychrobacter sp. PL19]|uniref:pilus assembly FimT family protein n=1 Tax=Psychrobacter sp. PL19 TaxID=2760711 RepID=UPI002FF031DA